MSAPKTLGEAVEQNGYAQAMILVAQLAEVLKHTPVGEWDYRFTSDPRWRLCVNGGESPKWTPPKAMAIPRYHAYLEFNGWPSAVFNPAEGTVFGVTEDAVIAALEKEIAAHRTH